MAAAVESTHCWRRERGAGRLDINGAEEWGSEGGEGKGRVGKGKVCAQAVWCGWLVAIPFLALASNLTGEEDRRPGETYPYMYTYIARAAVG